MIPENIPRPAALSDISDGAEKKPQMHEKREEKF